MTSSFSVVCVGDLMTDVVAVASRPTAVGSDTDAEVRVSGGGSAANTAAWLAALGQQVTFVGRVGDDALGRHAVEELARVGVRTAVTVDPDRPTGTVVVVVTPDGERSMYPDAGANAGLSPDDLPPGLLGPTTHLHLSAYTVLREASRHAGLLVLAAARAAGATISVDPASVAPLVEVGPDTFLDWVDGVDLLLANDDEAEVLAGVPGPHGLQRLAARFGAVVVTHGAGGASLVRADSEPVTVPAPEVPVVDSTGAGDAFAAGFLPPWRSGAPDAVALAAGCGLAGRVVVQVGARPPR